MRHPSPSERVNPVSFNKGTEDDVSSESTPRPPIVDYAILLKPRVMALVLFTGFTGMLLAPGNIDVLTATIAVTCIALGAGASGSINMWYDRDIDRMMKRTMHRPLPAGRLKPGSALALGTILSVLSIAIMGIYVNLTSGLLLAGTIAFYVFVYTIWLKRRTPQNIVIGGASGALPPMIGWAAVTNDVGLGSLVLFAIIFMWTPPHFWALALFRDREYSEANVPMLPSVKGGKHTISEMRVYTALLIGISAIFIDPIIPPIYRLSKS